MQLRPTKKPDLLLDMTPLIDVVFLLLIFFMVSTTFEHQAMLKVDLPEASDVADAAKEPKELELVIDKDGHFYLDNRQLVDARPATIRAALQAAAGDERDMPLVLRADAQTQHHFVVTAMDVAAQLGFKRLSIATEHVPRQ